MNFGWYLEQFSFKGRPVSGGTVEFFVAGSTTTPKNVWYDVDNTVIAPNPITLDASGTMPQIYPESGLYLIVLRDASGAILYTRDNVSGNEGGATDADLRRFYSWFMMDSSYTGTPPDEDRTKITVNDVQTMLEFGYCCTGNTQTTSTTTTSLWYVKAYDATNDIATWKEVIVDIDSEVINLDRGNCNYLLPHPDRFSTSDQNFTTYPAGLYTLVKDSADGFYWKPQVVKEYPEPTYSVSGALIYDASLHAYRWIGIDEIGGKVKVDANDSTAGYLADKLVSGDTYITFTKNGADNTNKTYRATLNINNVYDEIISKMNPPSYDLFGAYPDEVGVCQLTGIGASLKAKTLKDSNGNDLTWTYGIGENGANYGRSCIPGYSYVKNAQGTQVKKRVWCAFGSTGEIYNSFDRYQSTFHDTSLITADYGYSRIPQGAASCAAYILDNGNYYWMYGGFVDNYVYLLEDIPANYNDDGSFKSTGWVWTACPGLTQNVAHICSVKTGGFLYTGYQLGGVNYKPTIAGAGTQILTNPARTNSDLVRVIVGDGASDTFSVPCLAHQSYNNPTATAIDSNGSGITVANAAYNGGTNSIDVRLGWAPAYGLSVTITVMSYQYNPSYTGAGFSGVGSDHYGTYNVIDRDTGRIYTNTSEALTGTFTNSHVVGSDTISDWNLLSLYVRESDSDNYSATKVDRLGTTYGSQTGDPYTWWSGIQSAYGLWVATIALKQYASDPIYAYSDDGIHWTKYTDGVGIGTSSTLAIWDSQSDGMNWYVTNMFQPKPLIFELLVDSIPAHKRLVAEKGLGVSGDAFLVDLPNAGVLGTDENGKIIISSGSGSGTGTQGPQGATGAQGPQGAAGSGTGSGTQGPQGAQGSIGATGSQGLQGATGATGPQGTQGKTGTGTQGATGSTGPQGTQGASVQGPQGFQGSTGATGSQGPQGATGPQGPQGASVQGPQGSQGSIGATGLKGPQGFTGAQGATGTGTQGPQGSVGATGATGSQGVQGATGSTGAQGNQGSIGATGSTGAQGTQGATGTQGPQGSQGASVQGPQGSQGASGAGSSEWVGTLAQYTALGTYDTNKDYLITDDYSSGGTGAQGPQGSIGATGPQGSAGAANITVSTSAPSGSYPDGSLWLVVSA